MKKYTKQELRNEIDKIRTWAMRNLSLDKQIQLLERKDFYLHQQGYIHCYLKKNASLAEISYYLDAWVKACYDIAGTCC